MCRPEICCGVRYIGMVSPPGLWFWPTVEHSSPPMAFKQQNNENAIASHVSLQAYALDADLCTDTNACQSAPHGRPGSAPPPLREGVTSDVTFNLPPLHHPPLLAPCMSTANKENQLPSESAGPSEQSPRHSQIRAVRALVSHTGRTYLFTVGRTCVYAEIL